MEGLLLLVAEAVGWIVGALKEEEGVFEERGLRLLEFVVVVAVDAGLGEIQMR